MTEKDVFRKEYKPLTEEQKKDALNIKLAAENLLNLMDKAVPAGEHSDRSRYMAIARTNLEQTIMWATKAVTE